MLDGETDVDTQLGVWAVLLGIPWRLGVWAGISLASFHLRLFASLFSSQIFLEASRTFQPVDDLGRV